jgi:hypothetical protein
METSDPVGLYPLASWQDDFDWYHRECSKLPPAPAKMEIADVERHFYETRPNPEVAQHCLARFSAAMSYLDANSKSILVGKLGVSGRDVSLMSNSVWYTLYRLFVTRPDAAVNVPIPLDVFMREARSDFENPPKH